MQRSFDDLGTPLADVTFCVIDLETTGGAPDRCGITEIGAVKLRGGECLGTFQTLVNPGMAIPPEITVLTGITQSMVVPAPRIESVLPALLEFIGGAVIVGHNVRFDLGFLRAALERSGRPALTNRSVDTVALARRLVRDEVPNCRLGTLADRLRLSHRPSHRALDDALTTGDLLHLLIERASGLGVTGLDDLIALPRLAAQPRTGLLRSTESLPRAPGVYVFRDVRGEVLYVGKATDLRSRVRSYFAADGRRKVGQLLREAHRVEHLVGVSTLEAAVAEVRLIHAHQPRFNRQLTRWRSYAYLKLTAERFPRLSIVADVRPDGALYLGPVSSRRVARLAADAIETALPLRRCAARPGREPSGAPCTAAQLGVAACPCSGLVDEVRYGAIVDQVRRGLGPAPELIFEPLERRMRALAAEQRFEEATDVRERARALAGVLSRQRRLHGLVRAGSLRVEAPSGIGAELDHGLLVRVWGADGAARAPVGPGLPELEPDAAAIPRHAVDELACVAAWLDGHAATLRLVHVDRGWHSPLPALPRFEPGTTAATVRRRPAA